ncbi:MAG: hypothetical protein AAB646_00805 [Patescibacteria group bacterium]
MQVIPAINAKDRATAEEQIKIFLEFSDLAHLDVTDGFFSREKLWGSPEELRQLKIENLKLKIEAHLMVQEPEKAIDQWLSAGAKKVIIHLEAIKNDADIYGEEIAIAINPETPAHKLLKYKDKVKQCLLLAVKPGPSGQKFDPAALEKIKFLRSNWPNVIIEVDGGINPETAKLCKDAGADIVVSGSYIFGSPDPEKAYQKLTALK